MKNPISLDLDRKKLHDQITDHLQNLIVTDALQPGDKLPGERDLGTRLGVSRTVIREAIRTLTVRGLVEVQPGNGTFIKQLSPHIAAEPIRLLLLMEGGENQFQNLMEILRVLEIEIAGLAAEKASDENLAALKEAIIGQQANIDIGVQFTKFDLAFHDTLIQATQNKLFQVLLSPVTDLLLDFRMAAFSIDPTTSVQEGIKHHQLIYEYIHARDIAGARKAMRKHLEQAEAVYSQFQSGQFSRGSAKSSDAIDA